MTISVGLFLLLSWWRSPVMTTFSIILRHRWNTSKMTKAFVTKLSSYTNWAFRAYMYVLFSNRTLFSEPTLVLSFCSFLLHTNHVLSSLRVCHFSLGGSIWNLEIAKNFLLEFSETVASILQHVASVWQVAPASDRRHLRYSKYCKTY